MIVSQSMGEYAGSRIFDRAADAAAFAYQWVENSLARDTPAWIAVGVCAVLGYWLLRRR